MKLWNENEMDMDIEENKSTLRDISCDGGLT
jgi:hypothetical protein